MFGKCFASPPPMARGLPSRLCVADMVPRAELNEPLFNQQEELMIEKRSFGSAGLAASLVGLGCNNFGMKIDLEATRAVINAALDAGVTFWDTADMYGGTKSEEFIG